MRHLLSATLIGAGLLAAGAATAQPAHCPPGLAKKNPPCVPPGQARQGVTVGAQLPPGVDYIILGEEELRRLGLAPQPGIRYIVVDNEVFRIADATRKVLDAIGAVQALTR